MYGVQKMRGVLPVSNLMKDDDFWKIYIEIEQGTCIEETDTGLTYFENGLKDIKFGHKDKNKNSMLDAVIAQLKALKDD